MDKREYSESSQRLYLRENSYSSCYMVETGDLNKIGQIFPRCWVTYLWGKVHVCICVFVGM